MYIWIYLTHGFRQNASIWLNDVALTAIRKVGKVTSLTVSPSVENTLTLHYGGSVQTWTLTITPGEHSSTFSFVFFFDPLIHIKCEMFLEGTTLTKVRGQQKPQQQPLSDTEVLIQTELN